MNIDLVRLNSNIIDKIDIDEKVVVSDDDLKQTEIIELKDTYVKGYITKDGIDDYNIVLRIYGTMILPCSVSLKPTKHEFDIEIDEKLSEILEESEKSSIILENTIDIFPIIWENILMENPIRIVNEDIKDVKLKGDGWRVVDKIEEEESTNPELEKLKDLLK